jgi:hypothetical protein
MDHEKNDKKYLNRYRKKNYYLDKTSNYYDDDNNNRKYNRYPKRRYYNKKKEEKKEKKEITENKNAEEKKEITENKNAEEKKEIIEIKNAEEKKEITENKNEEENKCRDCVIYDDKKESKPLITRIDSQDESDKKIPSIFFSSLYSKSIRDKLNLSKQDSLKKSFSSEFSSLLKLLEESSKEKDNDNDNDKENKFECKNSNCDHNDETYREPLNFSEIKNIDGLLELAKTFHCKSNKMFYNINLRILHELIESLNDINKIIGMKKIKDKLVDQILYFLQGYHNKGKKCLECVDCKLGTTCMKNQSDMLHTVITGPPGVGKTMLAKHLANLYNKIGILKTNKFKLVSRSDLVGKYLGETAIKTQAVIDEADGGVLFIDEAYSLGYTGERDFYSKECIDTLTKNLSERKTFICIIAGYKESLEKCFFSHNEGLNRRFTFRYDLEKYSWKDLRQIFEIKVKKEDFSIGYGDEIDDIFKNNEKYFINNGGDMETLYLKTKLAHCRNIKIKPEEQFILTAEDVKKGIHDLIETRKNNKEENYNHVYM